ncbi:MAG: inositol monophosphatase [Anaerolinea sp.]|nr:inositol monophosphatase [Anaerolinea sp.]
MANALSSDLLPLACEAAAEAGSFIRGRAAVVRELVDSKSTSTDMVTEVDHAAERMIVNRLLAARPDDGVLGEEGTDRPSQSGVRWIIDPLDGTTSYIYGYPAYSVSIAAEAEGEVVAGAVYDAAHALLYSAARGKGAFRDGHRIHVTHESRLGHALTGTGFGYDPARRAAQAALVARVLPRVRDIRRSGSAALDLCWVAAGHLDAYFEQGLNVWDMAAGLLIVGEAGGVTGWAERLAPPAVIATNQALFEPLRALLNAAD